MSILYDRIVQWKEENNSSIYAIEKGTGLAKGTIKKWKDTIPAGDTVLRVANYMDVSTDYLLGNTLNPNSHKNNQEDCAAATTALIDIIQEYLSTTENAYTSLNSKIKQILIHYHLKLPKRN